MSITFRSEDPSDHSAINELLGGVFGGEGEIKLIEDCRVSEEFISQLAIVALDEGKVVGHILFHPVLIETKEGNSSVLTMAPMAVSPDVQNKGVGTKLLTHGLNECKRLGHKIVVVIGHPNFFAKFGFIPAIEKGLEIMFPVPDEAFMVCELEPGALDNISGTVEFPGIFVSLF